jgi:hypothetical protein
MSRDPSGRQPCFVEKGSTNKLIFNRLVSSLLKPNWMALAFLRTLDDCSRNYHPERIIWFLQTQSAAGILEGGGHHCDFVRLEGCVF